MRTGSFEDVTDQEQRLFNSGHRYAFGTLADLAQQAGVAVLTIPGGVMVPGWVRAYLNRDVGWLHSSSTFEYEVRRLRWLAQNHGEALDSEFRLCGGYAALPELPAELSFRAK